MTSDNAAAVPDQKLAASWHSVFRGHKCGTSISEDLVHFINMYPPSKEEKWQRLNNNSVHVIGITGYPQTTKSGPAAYSFACKK